MAIPLKQSTASQEVPLGYFLDSSDGDTAETGLTIANTDIKLWKAGASTLANKNSGGATHIAGGVYYCTLDATDTNTLGPLIIFVHASGALAVRVECVVLAANVYDSLIGGSDYLDVNAAQIEGGDATDAINAEVDTALGDYDPPTKAELDSGLAGLNDPTAAAIRAEIDSNSTQLAAIVADTNELQTDDVPGLIGALNDLSAAEVNAEVDTALADYDPPTKAELDTAVADVSVDEIQASALADLFNTDSGTDYASAAAGSVVKEIADNAGGSSLTEAGIADAVWDEALSGHTGGGSAGEALDNAGSGASASDIADAVWDEAKSGHVGAGSFGEEVQAHSLSSEISALNDPTAAEIRAEIDSNSTQLAAILADTDELQTDLTDGGRLDLLIDAIKAVTDNLPDSGALTTLLSNVAAILADTGTDGVVLANDAITAAKIATNAIDAGAIAADAIGSSELAATAASEVATAVWSGITEAAAQYVADEVLKRSAENVEDTASTDSLAELIMAGLNAAISGTTLTIRKPSDDSSFNTRTVTTDSGADPVVGVT
jgi:hypothetical protein